MSAYSQEEIRAVADSMIAGGASWDDVWAKAQQYGVGMGELRAAYGNVPADSSPAAFASASAASAAAQFASVPRVNASAPAARLGSDLLSQIIPAPGGSGWLDTTPKVIGDKVFQVSYTPAGFGEDANPAAPEWITVYDPNAQRAGQDQFAVYRADGSFSNVGTFKTDDALKTFLMAAAAAVGMQFLPGGLFGGSTAASGGSGAFLGEGVASGVPAWDAAAVNAGISLPGAGTLVNPFLGEGVASGVPAWDGAAVAAGVPISPGGMIIENVGDVAGDALASSPPRPGTPIGGGGGGSGAWLGEGVPSGVPAWDAAAAAAGVPLTNVPLPPLPSSPLPSLPGSITLDTSGLTSALAGITQTVAGIPGLIASLLPKPAAPVVAGSTSAGPLGLPWLAWGALAIGGAYLVSRKA